MGSANHPYLLQLRAKQLRKPGSSPAELRRTQRDRMKSFLGLLWNDGSCLIMEQNYGRSVSLELTSVKG